VEQYIKTIDKGEAKVERGNGAPKNTYCQADGLQELSRPYIAQMVKEIGLSWILLKGRA